MLWTRKLLRARTGSSLIFGVLVVACEWERGTMEALMVTPLSAPEFLLGKLIPYFFLGMGGMALSMTMAIGLFGVPFLGSFIVLFVAAALFLLAALGMGLLISTISKNQFVAGQIAIITAFVPAFILSGFIFDLASMPRVVQIITLLVPARYFVVVLQTVFTNSARRRTSRTSDSQEPGQRPHGPNKERAICAKANPHGTVALP